MSRHFELLRQVRRGKALLQQAQSSTPTNSRNFEVLRQAKLDRRLFERVDNSLAEAIEPVPQRGAGFSHGETFKLVQRLFLTASAAGPRAVLFCPAAPASDRDWTCANVADLLTVHAQGSVCIVDANLANPSLHTFFKVENHRGLAEAILDAGPIGEFVKPLGRGNLSLLSAGVLQRGMKPESVMSSERLRARMGELRASFDYVVMDAPSTSENPSTAYLASMADGAILVVEPSFTPRQEACLAKESIEAAGGQVLGVVLHRRMLAIPMLKQKNKPTSDQQQEH